MHMERIIESHDVEFDTATPASGQPYDLRYFFFEVLQHIVREVYCMSS
jgi:hypothetical protein